MIFNCLLYLPPFPSVVDFFFLFDPQLHDMGADNILFASRDSNVAQEEKEKDKQIERWIKTEKEGRETG